jgi:transketolase
MALAERMLAARFGSELVDHHTYAIAGDGCLMEGISHEAISLAGHLKLNKLIVLFDDNSITIDGPTSLSVSDDQVARFKAAGWATQRVDGHDPEAVAKAIEAAHRSDRPSLIACRTVIGYGAPTKAGTAGVHGAALGAKEVEGAREKLGWSHAPFEVPGAILDAWRAAGRRGAGESAAWRQRLAKHPERAEFERRLSGALPAGFEETVATLKRGLSEEKPKLATRVASQRVLEALVPAVPEMVGGSADLTHSNNTIAKAMKPVAPAAYDGRYIYYGVREHGMAAAMNGIALHGGFIPYGGTFLVFTDYCRPSIRLSALMGVRVVYVMTHDSIGLGEDGPTHQPVEHLAALRAIPNLSVYRPADAVETAECWALALEQADRPSVIALTRQALPAVRTELSDENLSARGAYILSPADRRRQVTLLATGSEVQVALAAQKQLAAKGIAAAAVSMPSWDRFEAQPVHYRDEVLGPGTLKVAIEAASPFGWERYIGREGAFIGMTGFGASAPADALFKHFHITAEAVVAAVTARL